MELNDKELDQIRQWFNCIQDIAPSYLLKPDYRIAAQINEHLGFRVPDSITKHL